MDAATELNFIRRVLSAYDAADMHEMLFWRVGQDVPGEIKLLALCNDTFWWATADAEEITPDNVDILEQTLHDLQCLDLTRERPATSKTDMPLLYLSELFAARSRKMRPQQPCYKNMSPAIAALFNDCGPVRDPKSDG